MTCTPFSISLLTRPSNCAGAYVWKWSLSFLVPLTSWPVMTTRATWPESAACMNSLNVIVFSACWNFVEKFQMSTPRTTSAIQNNRLFNVEFTRKPLLVAQAFRPA